MPELTRVITAEQLAGRAPTGGVELGPYFEILEAVQEQGGVGAEVTLAEGENQRTEKRRLSVAAKHQGYELTWRKSSPGTLRFVLSREGQAVPGARKRRAPADVQTEQTAIDAIMTEDVAAVTDTEAAEEASSTPGPRRRGRSAPASA